MADQVSFTQMKDGTEEDYLLLAEREKPYLALTADRILDDPEGIWDQVVRELATRVRVLPPGLGA